MQDISLSRHSEMIDWQSFVYSKCQSNWIHSATTTYQIVSLIMPFIESSTPKRRPVIEKLEPLGWRLLITCALSHKKVMREHAEIRDRLWTDHLSFSFEQNVPIAASLSIIIIHHVIVLFISFCLINVFRFACSTRMRVHNYVITRTTPWSSQLLNWSVSHFELSQ